MYKMSNFVPSPHLPDSLHQLLVIRSLVWEPLSFFMDHHQPLVHSAHLLVKRFLLPSRSVTTLNIVGAIYCQSSRLFLVIPGDNLGQTVVVDKPVAILLVVDVKLGILPVVDDSAILSAAVIFSNNLTPLFPGKRLFELK